MICRRTCYWPVCSFFVFHLIGMKRVIIMMFCLGLGVLLAWCGGGSSTMREITVAWYTFSLPEAYVAVSPSLVENKQLVNKVIWSYKLPSETKWTFEPNIIVTRSDLPPELNFEQFRTLNAQKMNAQLAWYQPWTKEVVSFICNDREIQWLLVYFRLQDPWYTTHPEVWMAQYQFVDNQKWYIISAAYSTEQEQQWFADLVDTLSCTPPPSLPSDNLTTKNTTW